MLHVIYIFYKCIFKINICTDILIHIFLLYLLYFYYTYTYFFSNYIILEHLKSLMLFLVLYKLFVPFYINKGKDKDKMY